ncbi:MAG TPA: thiol reductant ABC exporter subunit CydC [Dermatophilaceae bacterium]|nr:thiol reductant ABC exporter subunit CydC [Dermatophilaceae bacterium]
MTSRHSRTVLLAGLVGGAATASGIALTATSGWLIVRASERPVILTLLVAIVAVRAFGMARPFFRYVERLMSHDAALDDLAVRRTDVYAGLIPLTPARLGRRARSEVLTGVVDDLTDVVEASVRVTVPIVSSLVAGLVAVVLTALLWPPVGLVLAGLLLVLALGCQLAWVLESRSQRELLSARAEVMRVSDLVARQADELRAVGGEATALRWLTDAHDALRRAVATQSRGRALVAGLVLAGTGAATVAAAYLARAADVSGPVAALLVVVPVALGDALAPLAEAMRALARAQAGSRRLDALLDQRPAVAAAVVAPACATDGDVAANRQVRDRPRLHADGDVAANWQVRDGEGAGRRAPHLTLRGLTGSWTGESRDLAPLDLDLPPGRRVAVIGANGSGKSTLLALLARHLDPVDGTYLVDGVDALATDLEEMRAHIAVVDDEPHVFAATLRANLLVAAPDATDNQARAALRRAGLGAWLEALPEGLDTRLGGGRGVSGGERARLGLARALLSERPVVLLDEPVAHLDHATATAVLDDVVQATAARTVVMVSHRPEGLTGFDDVLDLTPEPAAPKEK